MRRPDVGSPGTDRSSTASSPSRSGAASAEHGFPDDTPAGTGYLTVAVLTISAILTAIMTLRTPQRGADDATTPDQPQQTSPRWPQPLAMIVYGSAILERLAWGFTLSTTTGWIRESNGGLRSHVAFDIHFR
jgi:hypothetical protein